MKPFNWSWILALAIVTSPSSAFAQCSGGMMGSSHEHDRASSKGDRKTRETINKLLGQEHSRSLLLEALLTDEGFMSALFGRVAAAPELRELAAKKLGADSTAPAEIDSSLQAPRPPAAEEEVVYRCPMHPEVVSGTPGKCPKCGMTLERSEQ